MGTAQHNVNNRLTPVRGNLFPCSVSIILKGTAQSVIIAMMEQLIVSLKAFHLTADLSFLLCSALTQIHLVTESSAHGNDSPGL